MTIIFKLLRITLNIVYLPFKVLRTMEKITFISKQSDTPSSDFLLIQNAINDLQKAGTEIETVMLCKKMGKGITGKISYSFNFLSQMRHISQSKIIVIDRYCAAASLLKHKKSLEIVQIWHALGAIKKFGYSTIGKKEGWSENVTKGMKIHCNYTKAFVSSEYYVGVFSEAYNVKKEIIEINPLPVVDLFRDKENIENERKKIFSLYPNLQNNTKSNIVYAPTYRKDNTDFSPIFGLITNIDTKKYNLIIKVHPSMKFSEQIILDNLPQSEMKDKIGESIIVSKHFSTQSMLMVADCVVSDYSAIAFEAAILDLPMSFYVYDYMEYTENRDFYVDYMKEMPGYIFENPLDINKSIENSNCEKYNSMRKVFLEKHVSLTEEKQSVKIAKRLIDIMGRE